MRKVAVDDLPDEIKEQASGAGLTSLYAIGNEDGEQLGAGARPNMAFVVARQNDMTPVSVH